MSRTFLGLVLVVVAALVVWIVAGEEKAPAGVAPPAPAPRSPSAPTPPRAPLVASPGSASSTTPPRPEAPSIAGAPELDEIARELSLRPDQRERVRSIFIAKERELEKALRVEAADTADSEVLARITSRVLAGLDAEVREVLDAEQRARFDRMR